MHDTDRLLTSVADPAFWRKAFSLVFYLSVSLALTCWSKYFATVLRAPLSISCVHMLTTFVGSMIAARIQHSTLNPSLRTYLLYILPIGLLTAVDLGLSNTSLMMLDVSVFTMIRSVGPALTLVFAVLFQLEQVSWALSFSVMLVVSGSVFACSSSDEESFSWLGSILVVIGSACASFKACLVHFTLQHVKTHPASELSLIDVLFYSSPLCALGLVPFAAVLEGDALVDYVMLSSSGAELSYVAGLVLLGACLVLAQAVAELLLISSFSGLTFSICSVVREYALVGLGVVLFQETVSLESLFGLALACAGLLGYQWHKRAEGGSELLDFPAAEVY
jgi:drug/metabolite transporter (DMT)-like permease